MSSNELCDRACTPCKGGVPPLKGEDLKAYLDQLEGDWRIENEHHLIKDFIFSDFAEALAFTNRVGQLAENIGHHPDILLSWGKVTIQLWTHKIDGLVEADFVMAAKIDKIER